MKILSVKFFALVICVVSLTVFIATSVSIYNSNQIFSKAYAGFDIQSESQRVSTKETTNEKITNTRRSLQRASRSLYDSKGTIRRDLSKARLESSLAGVRRVLSDIEEEAIAIQKSHLELEIEFFDLLDLYNEKVTAANQAGNSNKMGGALFSSLFGFLGSILTLIFLWRQDLRDVTRLRLEKEERAAKRNAKTP